MRNSNQQFLPAQLAAINGAGSICSAALGDRLLQSTTEGGVAVVPNFVYVEVLSAQPARVPVRLTNTGQNTIVKLQPPSAQPGSVVSYAGVTPSGFWEGLGRTIGWDSAFTLDPSQNRTVTFNVKQPSEPVRSETIQLPHASGQGGVDIAFAVARAKPKPRPENCDYLHLDGHCGQCTIPLEGSNLNAQTGHPPISMRCQTMSEGPFHVTWRINVAPEIPCAPAGCAGFDGTLTVRANNADLFKIPVVLRGNQVIGKAETRRDPELALQAPSEVTIRYDFGQAYTQDPYEARRPFSFVNSSVTIKSLKK